MKRAPIVLAGTAIGLVGLVSYHTTTTGSIGLTAGLTGPASTGASSTSTTGTGSAAASGSTTAHSSTTGASKTGSSQGTSTGATPASQSSSQGVGPALTRTATGKDIRYGYGSLSVKITMLGSKITDVALAQANVADQQSANIDQYVFPILRREVLSAQSARIQGISGASYTSQAYAESLQSAIDKLTTAHA